VYDGVILLGAAVLGATRLGVLGVVVRGVKDLDEVEPDRVGAV
jgi:hypothetical protein